MYTGICTGIFTVCRKHDTQMVFRRCESAGGRSSCSSGKRTCHILRIQKVSLRYVHACAWSGCSSVKIVSRRCCTQTVFLQYGYECAFSACAVVQIACCNSVRYNHTICALRCCCCCWWCWCGCCALER